MKLWALLAFTALLAGCNNDNQTGANAVTDGSAPSVYVPPNAFVTDYSCVTVHEYTDAIGDAKHRETTTTGAIRYWKDSGYSFSFDESSDGKFKSLAKYQRYGLNDGQYRVTSEYTTWDLTNGAWTKKVEEIERTWQKAGDIRRVLSNRVNGADAPFYWEFEDTQVDSRTVRSVQRHTNPSVRDHDGLHYTKIEVTCTDTNRQ